MNILEEIVTHTKKKVALRKKKTSIQQLESTTLYKKDRISLKKNIQKKQSAIIAEIKFSSPSKGKICPFIDPAKIALGYQKSGAAAISVLTEENYFAGKMKYLIEAREVTHLPILRKDFILEEYQILESRSIGADAILLIAANLTPKKIFQLAQFAHSLKLEVLLEVHSLKELEDSWNNFIDIIGVNNRDLKTLKISIDKSLEIIKKISPNILKISESGLSNAAIIKKLNQVGFNGYLIGESLMQTTQPAKALKDLITQL